MILPKHLGHYLRVGLATCWTCIAVWETLQNGLMHLHVLLRRVAAVIIVIAVIVEGVRIRRDRRD